MIRDLFSLLKRPAMSLIKPNILIVEDDESTVFGYNGFLVNCGFTAEVASTLKDASEKIKSASFDIVLLDLKLPDGNALHWIPQQKKAYPDIAIIVITGMRDIPTAVQAIKDGAENFLTKPVVMEELKSTLDKCIELRQLRKRNLIRQRLDKTEEPLFGESPKTVQLLDYARLAASNHSVILLQGETGTGKGLLARWIHDNSDRRSEPFVEINCSYLKGDLLRSELFGHVKGAFTSAVKGRDGLIEIADGGTLFLDEISDMDLEMQAQLLKTIEEKSFRRIGENILRKSDFRLICASNRNMLQETKEKRFRSDLYYRICVFPITLPPLRERNGDIPGLAEHFLERFGYTHVPLSGEIIELLLHYNWPGNIRELKNMLERACMLAQGMPLVPDHFPGFDVRSPESTEYRETETINELVNKHIQRTLEKYHGDKRAASKALGVSFSNLYRKLSLIPETEQVAHHVHGH
jgi:DNA-binding NtrC family response regulator